jgi:hypothetical protein
MFTCCNNSRQQLKQWSDGEANRNCLGLRNCILIIDHGNHVEIELEVLFLVWGEDGDGNG